MVLKLLKIWLAFLLIPAIAPLTPIAPFTSWLGTNYEVQAQCADTWTQKADFGGSTRSHAVAFSIGAKGYLGIGSGGPLKKDFWEYDPNSGTWTQKADFGGTARWGAVGFSINTMGYVGTGYDSTYKKDFWEYNPSVNVWTQKADFGGTPRHLAVGFSIGVKGYIGTGLDGVVTKDFWEFDPSTDTWTQKADFGGTARRWAVGFSIDTIGYIGTGYDISAYKKDFWEYNPSNDTWSQKADVGGTARRIAVGFSIGGKGYIGTGEKPGFIDSKDFWEYDSSIDTWTQKVDFGGTERKLATGFSLGAKGYIGTGNDGGYTKDFWEYTPKINDIIDSCPPNKISGYVFLDTDSNCIKDSSEYPSWNQKIKIEPKLSYIHVNENGYYETYLDSGDYTISLIDNNSFLDQVCPDSLGVYPLSLDNNQDTITSNFGVYGPICPNLSVSLAHVGYRPCFSSWYKIRYANNGSEVALFPYIEIGLPNEVTATTVSGNSGWNQAPWNATPWDSQNGDVYTYQLGNVLYPGQSGSFFMLIEISCNAQMGQTLCTTAHIYPDGPCTPLDSSWDKSSVAVEGACVDDSLACFTIYNTGDPGSGDMADSSEYRVYRNNYLIEVGSFMINGGDSVIICVAAYNGTIRLEADQRPGHPGSSHPQDNVEMCGNPNFVLGQITQVPADDADHFIDIECSPVVNSWDPNDKTVVPEGVTDQHFIDSTDILEYRIRFQNTGTAEAINVYITDTISPYLDITTIRPTVASHNYKFDIIDSNIVRWSFEYIMLPDSNANEPASHGFVKYEIHQQPNNAKGTVINNKANIYFDFNPPVITDEVVNVVHDTVLVPGISVPKLYISDVTIAVYPNPFNSTTTFEITGLKQGEPVTIQLFNLIGKKVKEVRGRSNQAYILSRDKLIGGIYFYQIHSGLTIIGTGKLIIE